MSPAKALLCATRDGGAAFDASGMLGTLEKGKYADLLIVNGDPIADIKILQDHSKFSAIIKGGVIYRDLIHESTFKIAPEAIFTG
jgi:imidazolonepropionase-like amidohydrolase